MKKIKLLLSLAVLITFSACNQKPTATYKVAYVNLQQVYNTIPELAQADSIHKLQLKRIDGYVNNVNLQFKNQDIDKQNQEKLLAAYNDTIITYRKQIDKVLQMTISKQNNRIQSTIDSIAKQLKYNYVLSTENSNILYVADSTNNITDRVIEVVGNN